MSIFEGLWVPLITPFRQQKPDVAALQAIARQLVQAGVNGLVICGVTGEAALLEDDEPAVLLSALREVLPPGFPLMLGLDGSHTRHIAERIRKLEQTGHAPQAYLVAPPSFIKPSQEGVCAHYRHLMDATALPLILHNIPSRTGVALEFGSIEMLAASPQIAGIKDCTGKLEQAARILRSTRLRLFCGDDHQLFDYLSIGAHGAISPAAHLRTDLFIYLLQLIREGRTAPALLLFRQLLPLIRMLYCEPHPAPLKAALSLQGTLQEELRLPLTPMSKTGKQYLARELQALIQLPSVASMMAEYQTPTHASTWH